MRGGRDTQRPGVGPSLLATPRKDSHHPTPCYLGVEADIGAADIQYNLLAETTVGADLQ